MPASFGLVPELGYKIKDKKLRYKAIRKIFRGVKSLKFISFSSEKDLCPVDIN